MSYDAQQPDNFQFTWEASNTDFKTSSDPFISQILTQLGLGDRYALKEAPFPWLLSELRNPDWQIRVAVARRLGKLGEQAAFASLSAVLMQDTHFAVKAAAARALGELANYASIEALLTALDDPTDEVKAAAAWALGEMGGQIPASTPLENLLDCDNVSVRVAAVRALGEMGARAPLHILAAALEDADWQVREMAARTLQRQREIGSRDGPSQ